jgi:hypothetical protein
VQEPSIWILLALLLISSLLVLSLNEALGGLAIPLWHYADLCVAGEARHRGTLKYYPALCGAGYLGYVLALEGPELLLSLTLRLERNRYEK